MQFKVGFIEQFNQMEQIVQNVVQRPAIPQTLSEALRLAADQAEKIEQQQSRLKRNAQGGYFPAPWKHQRILY
jgi:anti-repressor protein